MVVKVAENEEFVLKIVRDMHPEDPRNWDNLGTMICSHGSYDLGDKNFNAKNYNSWYDMLQHKIIVSDCIYLPLYLLDHTQLYMNTTGFSGVDPQGWDWGQVGFIYAEKEKVKEKTAKEIKEVLKQEVETYEMYLRGEVYGFVLEKKNKCKDCGHISLETIDSCFGFYGGEFKDNGLYEHLPKKAKELVAALDSAR